MARTPRESSRRRRPAPHAETAQLEREIAQVAKPGHGGTATPARSAPSAPVLRVAYRLQLAPGEIRAVELARGRYAWPDMLATHISEGGLVGFTESEMWQWCDDVDSDAEGGHSPFPLASPALADKLQSFYDQRI